MSRYNGTKFDCSSMQLTAVPGYLPSSIVELDLDTNSISGIVNDNFQLVPNIRKLVLSNNDITAIRKDSFVSIRKLKVLDLSANLIQTIDCEAFRYLSELEVLDLSRTAPMQPPEVGNCYKIEVADGRCRSLVPLLPFQETVPLRIERCTWKGLERLQTLSLQYTQLDKNFVSSSMFAGLSNLRSLDLSWNELSHLKSRMFSPLKELEELHLYYYLKNLYFEENPLSCDPAAEKLQIWMRNVSMNISFTRDGSLPWQTYICHTPQELIGVPILMVDFTENKKLTIVLLATCSSIAGLFCLLGFTLYTKRLEIRYRIFLYRRKRQQYHPLEVDFNREFKYDVYVSFNNKDGEWVENELVRLERAPNNLKVCVCYRDFPGGVNLFKCIEDAMKNSRKILFVVSNNFVRSKWCNFEIQYATGLLLDTNQNNVLFVVKENVPRREMSGLLALLMNVHKYLEWPNDERNRRTFQQELEMALQANIEI
ncbi:toll-like receptor 2 [Glandiceps talaboti]